MLAHALDRSVLQAVAHNAETLALTLIFGLICIYLFRCAALHSVLLHSLVTCSFGQNMENLLKCIFSCTWGDRLWSNFLG